MRYGCVIEVLPFAGCLGAVLVEPVHESACLSVDPWAAPTDPPRVSLTYCAPLPNFCFSAAALLSDASSSALLVL